MIRRLTAPERKRQYDNFGVQVNARFPGGATLFGGAGWERVRENRCDEPDNPNRLRFCDEMKLEEGFGIPYQRQIKLAGSVPLPWGIQLGASFQSNQGTPTNTRDDGGISWLLTRTTRYPATCPECPNGVAPWATNQLVLPTLNGTPESADLQIRLARSTPSSTIGSTRSICVWRRGSRSGEFGCRRKPRSSTSSTRMRSSRTVR